MTNKNTLKRLLSTLACSAVIAAMAITFVGCGNNQAPATTEAPATETTTDTADEIADAIVEAVDEAITDATADDAALAFSVEVVDADGNTENFDYEAAEGDTVGAVLLNAGLIAGDESQYGLYVKTVNGITADYDVDGTYWAFYIDGEYASTGVDSTPVVDGSTYSFKVEK